VRLAGFWIPDLTFGEINQIMGGEPLDTFSECRDVSSARGRLRKNIRLSYLEDFFYCGVVSRRDFLIYFARNYSLGYAVS
jgi:hypothetical protein